MSRNKDLFSIVYFFVCVCCEGKGGGGREKGKEGGLTPSTLKRYKLIDAQ